MHRPAATPARSPDRLLIRGRWLLAPMAGAVSALGFPPWEAWPAALLGQAVLVALLVRLPSSRAFGAGFLFGLGHFLVGLGWLAKAFTYQSAMPAWFGHLAHAGLALFLALFPAVAALAARTLGRTPVALALAWAGALVLAEIARGWLFTGFPWNPPGLALLPIPGVRDAAAAIGADGLSALLALAAGALALAALGDRRGAAAVGGLALLLASPGLLRLGLEPQTPGPAHILLVQPNSSQAEKHAENGTERHLLAHVETTERALARLSSEERAQLAAVVWPEGAIEFPPDENPWVARLVTRALPPGAMLLAGGIKAERDPRGEAVGIRNSLFALDAAGRILHRYDKAHLVPGGEYLPLRAIAEPLGLARLVPGTLDFWPGPGPETVRLPGFPAYAAAICYEIIFPGRVVDRRKRPELILTVSSDAWFGPTGPPQHFALARLRAIEEGLPVVRVTPTGVTGVIDARGRVTAALPPDTAGTLLEPLAKPLPPTPFARFGQAIPAALALLLLALAAVNGRKRT
ncbi:apolipoprotein N-acyltransferase [Thermaurantiacus tibetensis]|uniref:apolipoprotein N-acyltransferase n=1 Tax=Thermaurantiacus tibetensis TaxID=2759035 RepID=UPI002E2D6355|nr:apolipoprotein N-acyltransferase [Thermaurantiacus tibetensis]